MSWWKHGVVYQIYPRSFHDASGDGTGDLAGICEKLDYLAWLGIDAIWLSPVFPSPMRDFGYDVQNYVDIDPLFGTLEDFDRLVAEAHRRDIRVVLDLVMNHTSDLHPWFQDSRHCRNGRDDWYMWSDGIRGPLGRRRPPNNWRAAFGGPAWTWDPERGQYYLHLFLPEQPDLNWRHPAVEHAMFRQAEFWLDRGADGFRLDVINYIVKDAALRSNPYRLHRTFPRRHDQQNHLRDRNQPETHDILKRFRSLLDRYGATMAVGEIYPNEGVMEPAVSATYLGNGTDELHLAFDFSLLARPFSAVRYRRALETWYQAIPGSGWPCHVLSNHDKSRAMTRVCRGSIGRARILAAMLLLQRGTPFLYYGEEIGMQDSRLRRTELQDPLGRKYWPLFPGRDPARTPMQWNGRTNAGFCLPGTRPWLPVHESAARGCSVEAQRDDPESLLAWYRFLIQLRKTRPELTRGDLEFLPSHRDVLAWTRRVGGSSSIIILNFSETMRPSPHEGPDLRGLEVRITHG